MQTNKSQKIVPKELRRHLDGKPDENYKSGEFYSKYDQIKDDFRLIRENLEGNKQIMDFDQSSEKDLTRIEKDSVFESVVSNAVTNLAMMEQKIENDNSSLDNSLVNGRD